MFDALALSFVSILGLLTQRRPILKHISQHLPTSPNISQHLPTSPNQMLFKYQTTRQDIKILQDTSRYFKTFASARHCHCLSLLFYRKQLENNMRNRKGPCKNLVICVEQRAQVLLRAAAPVLQLLHALLICCGTSFRRRSKADMGSIPSPARSARQTQSIVF